MATNFNIKSIDASGAVIRLLANDKLIDCRFTAAMPEDQRMGWLKQTANECLRNMGLSQHVASVPVLVEDISDDPEHPVYVERFAPETNTGNLPDSDIPDETPATFWGRVAGWFN